MESTMSVKELIFYVERMLTTLEQFISDQEFAFGMTENFIEEIISPDLVNPRSKKKKSQSIQSLMDLKNRLN